MRFKSVVILVVVLMACSLSFAADGNGRNFDSKIKNGELGGTRAGLLGNLTASLSQTGVLEATGVVSVTTASPGATNTSMNLVVILGQIYDYPWAGGTTGTGTNTFVSSGTSFFPNTTGLGAFSDSYTFTVNVPNTYQIWAGAWAGKSWTGTSYWFSYATQSGLYYSSGNTTYVDDIQPPTPTPDPNAGGQPIPTLNWLGMMAMIAMMLGVAVLVFIRRR